MSEQKFTIPTELVELPSRGLIYPEDHPLSSGVVEMKYMTAKEEDILTNQNYINGGTVFYKVIESLLVNKVELDDIIIGDFNALLIASRILGYGKDYIFKTTDGKGKIIEKTIDLTTLKDKILKEEDMIEIRVNEFKYELPFSKNTVTYKLLTNGDQKKIDKELEGLAKLFPNGTPPTSSTRLKFQITSINGDRTSGSIREFVDKGLLAKEAIALRNEMKRVSPDVELVYFEEGDVEGTPFPISLNFFWPESKL